jgi:peptide deformylase
MILEIVQYGHPALRAKGRRIEEIDDEIRQLVEDMIETMIDADGVGLAAQQIGLPLQLCVVDVIGVNHRSSAMRIAGQQVEPSDHMPLILINPEIKPYGNADTGVEGCLSFPGVSTDITRPYSVHVKARTFDDSLIEFEADGLLARAVQHEYDHLQGILFIDHLEADQRRKLDPKIEALRHA